MSGMVQNFKDRCRPFLQALGFQAPATNHLKILPEDVLKLIVKDYLNIREQHCFKQVVRIDMPCACSPLCKLISNQFSKVMYRSLPQKSGIHQGATGRLAAFFYDRQTARVITGDESDYTSKAAVNVSNTEGQLQLSMEDSQFAKSVIAVKEVDGLIIAFSRREFGIWNAETSKKIKGSQNLFELERCVFSADKRTVFISGRWGEIGYLDLMTESPWKTYHPFVDSGHSKFIAWMEEDSINGNLLIGCVAGKVTIWNQERQLVQTIQTGATTTGHYLYLPSKQLLFALIDRSTVGVWNTATGDSLKSLVASHPLAISSCGFNTLTWDEKKDWVCALWNFNREEKLQGTALIFWSIESGEQAADLLLVDPKSGLHQQVHQIAFEKSKGNLILTGGYGMQLWNRKGELLWVNNTLSYLSRFEWDQEAKKIFLLAENDVQLKNTLVAFDYNKKA